MFPMKYHQCIFGLVFICCLHFSIIISFFSMVICNQDKLFCIHLKLQYEN